MTHAEIQEQASAAMDLIFDHFKRSQIVSFYKTDAQEVLISDPTWNSDFDNPYATNISKTPQKRDISCRVWYFKEPELLKNFDGDENLAIRAASPIGRIKIQILAADFDWLKNASSFYFLGSRYSKDSDWRGVGIMGIIERYEITLKRND